MRGGVDAMCVKSRAGSLAAEIPVSWSCLICSGFFRSRRRVRAGRHSRRSRVSPPW